MGILCRFLSIPKKGIYYTMTSTEMRDNPLFMRNGFDTVGKWDIPLVKKQNLDLTDIQLVACSDTRANDNEINKKRGVHFFVDDFRFEGIYNNPERTLDKYSQYAFLLTPDFSLYSDMNYWRQLESVAKNRWVGAFWQHYGIVVIPTVSWSDKKSYDFCFDGIERHSIVAIGTIGCKHSKDDFLDGYYAMMNRIEPEKVICFGSAFPEMDTNTIVVDYLSSRKVVR